MYDKNMMINICKFVISCIITYFCFRIGVITKMDARLYTKPIICFIAAVTGSIMVIELSKIIVKISVCQKL